MFIATANSLHSHYRSVTGWKLSKSRYTEYEKLSISRRYLIDKQAERNGVGDLSLSWTDQAIKTVIHRYTKEAGVRNLEREIASVHRKIAKEVIGWRHDGKKDEDFKMRITPARVQKYLGPPKYRSNKAEDKDEIGITNGLAVTMVGGDLLTTEVTLMPGSGKLKLTGNLAKVMEESAHAALSYVRSKAYRWALSRDFQKKIDIHIHFPEGAIPKDGPSAGITMATSLVSAITRNPVRKDVAMTGEITLRGRVLPIGGLKEKVLAAHRAGIKTVIMPTENEKDIREIPKVVRNNIKLVSVSHMDEVIPVALLNAVNVADTKGEAPQDPLLSLLMENEGEQKTEGTSAVH